MLVVQLVRNQLQPGAGYGRALHGSSRRPGPRTSSRPALWISWVAPSGRPCAYAYVCARLCSAAAVGTVCVAAVDAASAGQPPSDMSVRLCIVHECRALGQSHTHLYTWCLEATVAVAAVQPQRVRNRCQRDNHQPGNVDGRIGAAEGAEDE
jgi:hypothetical protein